VELLIANLVIKYWGIIGIIVFLVLLFVRKKYMENPIIFKRTHDEDKKIILCSVAECNSNWSELSEKYKIIQDTVDKNKKEADKEFDKMDDKFMNLQQNVFQKIDDANKSQTEEIIKLWQVKNG